MEKEYLTFTISSLPGMKRVLNVPGIQCDTQTIRLYEDNVLVKDVKTVNDPDWDDINPPFVHSITNAKPEGQDIVYSLRTYDYIHPQSSLLEKKVEINQQIVRLSFAKAEVIVSN